MKTGCSTQLIWAYYYGKSIHTLKLCHIYNNQPQTYVSSLKILGALTSKQQPLHGNSQFIWNNQLKQKPVVFVSARSNIWASVQKNACQETKLHIIVWPHHAKDDPWRQHHAVEILLSSRYMNGWWEEHGARCTAVLKENLFKGGQRL